MTLQVGMEESHWNPCPEPLSSWGNSLDRPGLAESCAAPGCGEGLYTSLPAALLSSDITTFPVSGFQAEDRS